MTNFCFVVPLFCFKLDILFWPCVWFFVVQRSQYSMYLFPFLCCFWSLICSTLHSTFFLHKKWLCPYIHKHHHRQVKENKNQKQSLNNIHVSNKSAPKFLTLVHFSFQYKTWQFLPTRGYLGAGNEHPLEQIGGMLCYFCGILVVEQMAGFHAVSLVVHFTINRILALLNHTGFDVKLNFGLFGYEVGAHEMHHRLLWCNNAQYCLIWDRLFGTYVPHMIVSKLPNVQTSFFLFVCFVYSSQTSWNQSSFPTTKAKNKKNKKNQKCKQMATSFLWLSSNQQPESHLTVTQQPLSSSNSFLFSHLFFVSTAFLVFFSFAIVLLWFFVKHFMVMPIIVFTTPQFSEIFFLSSFVLIVATHSLLHVLDDCEWHVNCPCQMSPQHTLCTGMFEPEKANKKKVNNGVHLFALFFGFVQTEFFSTTNCGLHCLPHHFRSHDWLKTNQTRRWTTTAIWSLLIIPLSWLFLFWRKTNLCFLFFCSTQNKNTNTPKIVVFVVNFFCFVIQFSFSSLFCCSFFSAAKRKLVRTLCLLLSTTCQGNFLFTSRGVINFCSKSAARNLGL